MKEYICIACNGDGKETCDNPDHGFLALMSFRGAHESRCPCCGWDEQHKMKKWDSTNNVWVQQDCPHCKGTGEMTEQELNEFAEEYGWDDNPDDYKK